MGWEEYLVRQQEFISELGDEQIKELAELLKKVPEWQWTPLDHIVFSEAKRRGLV